MRSWITLSLPVALSLSVVACSGDDGGSTSGTDGGAGASGSGGTAGAGVGGTTGSGGSTGGTAGTTSSGGTSGAAGDGGTSAAGGSGGSGGSTGGAGGSGGTTGGAGGTGGSTGGTGGSTGGTGGGGGSTGGAGGSTGGTGGSGGSTGGTGGTGGSTGGTGGGGGSTGGAGGSGGSTGGAGGSTGGTGGGGGSTGGAGGSTGGTGGSGGSTGGAGGTGGSTGGTGGGTSDLPSCEGATFVDAIADGAWFNIDVSPGGGTSGIRSAINQARDQHPNQPVRIRLAPGTYADTLGAEMYVQRIQRTATTPIWIVATDPAPNATRLGHGINFVGVAYFAFQGLTIGPSSVGAWNGSSHANPQPLQAQAGIHISGAAINGGKSARKPNGTLDSDVYGKYDPSHHIVIRGVTIQNVFSPDAPDAVRDEGQSMDGIKFNQAEDVWVLSSTISQTSRHGIDNVGVHRAAFCGNTIAHTGGGLGIEAKGGSFEVLVEGNVLYDVRRVELGGESTDAVYYYSADGLYTYEAKRSVLRNNLIVDPREAAIELSGCHECTAVQNSVLFSSQYAVPGLAQGNVVGGDAIRAHASELLGTGDGAGSDCVSWNAQQDDYEYFDVCWGVGSASPAPVGRTLLTQAAHIVDNGFYSPNGIWKATAGQATSPCPLNLTGGTAASALTFDGNYWWNGTRPLPTNNDGCDVIAEGGHSVYSTTVASPAPGLTGTSVDATSMITLRSSASAALTPGSGSALLGAGWSGAIDAVGYDFLRHARPASWAIGALER